jgi:hypothetical protein
MNMRNKKDIIYFTAYFTCTDKLGISVRKRSISFTHPSTEKWVKAASDRDIDEFVADAAEKYGYYRVKVNEIVIYKQHKWWEFWK